MHLVLKHLFFSFVIVVTESRQFRFDYDYYPNVDGWLKFHAIPATWREAFTRCDYEGSVLASPTDLSMKLAMSTHMALKNKNDCPIFTGVHATFSKGDFYSIEGVSLAKMPVNWTTNEPDNADNSENCIIFLEDTTIADVNCSDIFPYMCFKKKNKNVVMTSCGTIDKDYELNTKTGNCYKFHQVGKSWQDAFMTCSAEGGYLAIINNEDEATYLKNIHEKNLNRVTPGSNRDILYLGFHDWGHEGIWRTIHGLKIEDAGYADWPQGQPDNAAPGQHCGAMFRSNKKLDDYWCERKAPFICEKSPDSLVDDNDLLN